METLSKKHAIVLNNKELFDCRLSPIQCVYILDGVYIGATNNLKRRVKEYVGRALRNEKEGFETPIMKYVKQRLKEGHKLKFFVISLEPKKEPIVIKRVEKRGVKLLNEPTAQTYDSCYGDIYKTITDIPF